MVSWATKIKNARIANWKQRPLLEGTKADSIEYPAPQPIPEKQVEFVQINGRPDLARFSYSAVYLHGEVTMNRTNIVTQFSTRNNRLFGEDFTSSYTAEKTLPFCWEAGLLQIGQFEQF